MWFANFRVNQPRFRLECRERYWTKYDRAKVPPYNGKDPPPAPGSLKATLFPPLLNEVQNKGTQGVQARYGAELPPIISIVRYSGRPVILGMEIGPKMTVKHEKKKTPKGNMVPFSRGHYQGPKIEYKLFFFRAPPGCPSKCPFDPQIALSTLPKHHVLKGKCPIFGTEPVPNATFPIGDAPERFKSRYV